MALVAQTASLAVAVADGGSGRLGRVMGGRHSWRGRRRRPDVASGGTWNRHRSVVGLAMVVIEPIVYDIHPFGRRMAHHRAMAVVRVGRLPGWQVADKMDEPAY